MKIVKIDYNNPDHEAIRMVAKAIDEGKIAVVPGDAVYTIVADAFNIEAVQKAVKIKKRNKAKPFNLGLYCLDDIAKYGRYNSLIEEIVKKFPKEPFTFVVPRKETVPNFLNPGHKTLGFRIPFNKVTSTLSKLHRSPIIGTSANVSELKNTYSVEELLGYFNKVFGQEIMPEIVLDAGKLPYRRPSTVIELFDEKVEIIREGEIDTSFLYKAIMRLVKDFKNKLNEKKP